MPIDYFVTNCQTQSKEVEFGLCDDPPPADNPAYIDENDPNKWISIIKNPQSKNVNFNAIDKCIDIRRSDNTMQKRCDGVLSYDRNLVFVELKGRNGGKWVKEGREQLTETINTFKNECDVISEFQGIRAHVCNNLRPQSHFGHAANIQKFKDDTGLILDTSQEIEV